MDTGSPGGPPLPPYDTKYPVAILKPAAATAAAWCCWCATKLDSFADETDDKQVAMLLLLELLAV